MRHFLLLSVLTPFLILAAGFRGTNVIKPLAAPSVDTAPANTITDTGASSGGNVTNDGGESITGRGIAYEIVPTIPDTADFVTMDGTGTGIFVSTLTGLSPETNYNTRAYAYNTDGVSYGVTEEFWTLSTQPSGAIGAVATTVDAVQIDLTFNALSTLTDADGYFILRRDNMTNPVVTNGQLPAGGEIITNITAGATTSYSDMGLTPGTQYNYLIVPYNFNGTDTETYHYLTGGTVNATTDPPDNTSTIVAAGGENGDLAYSLFQSGNINMTSQGLQVWSITLSDVAGTDGLPTILDDLTITEGSNNSAGFNGTLRAAAFFNGAAEVADGSIAGSNISFTNINLSIPHGGTVTLDLYVSFDNTVTDGQQLQFEISNATTTGSSSSFAALGTVESTHTAGTSNRIQVVATRLDFTSNPSGPVQDETNFSATLVAEDVNNNIDTDSNASVTLSGSGGGTLSSSTGLVQNLSNGTFSWSDLQFDVTMVGSSTVSAAATGLTGDSFNVTVLVPGVVVTPPPAIEFCAQNTNISLGDIVISEGALGDFGVQGAGEQQVFTIQVPSGYRFTGSSAAVSITETNPGPTDFDVSSVEQVSFRNSGRNFQFEYEITGTANLDEITISGLIVRKTGADQINNQPIIRVASTIDAGSTLDEIEALMNGNGPTQQDHGTINFGGVAGTLTQIGGGTGTICPNEAISFEATGGDLYEFFITPDGSTTAVSEQNGGSNLFVIATLNDNDSVSVRVTNSVTGCFGQVGVPRLSIEEEPTVSITQPLDGDVIVLGADPVPLIAEDLVGASSTTNGGTFTGTGVQDLGGNNFTFDPPSGGNFEIVYTFTSIAGCSDSDTINLLVQDFGPSLLDNFSSQYCIDDDPVQLIFNQTNLELCFISGDGISGNLASGYTFDPSSVSSIGTQSINVGVVNNTEQVVVGINYVTQCITVTQCFDYPFIGTICLPVEQCFQVPVPVFGPKTCANSLPQVIRQATVVFNVPVVSYDTPFEQYYCEDEVITANANLGSGNYELFGNGVQGDTIFKAADQLGVASFNIITEGIGTGVKQISYTVSDPINGGCSNTATTSFEVLPLPPAATALTAPDSIFYCIGDVILPITGISDDPLLYSLAWFGDAFDPNPLDTGLVFDISSIDNMTSSVNTYYVANASKLLPPERVCEGPRKRIVVTVGVIPDADFQVTGLCRSDSTRFTDLSTISQGTIDSWQWDFGDGTFSNLQNPVHKYATPGTYTVSLTARSERNCEDVIIRDITVFPELTASSFPYLQNFNTGANGWTSKALEEQFTGLSFPNSWQLQAPDGTKIEILDGNSWVTDNGSTTYEFLEKSWVECPCLDLSALDRPMVSFDLWTDTELGVDGAVLQITVDDGLTWYEIGDDQSGVNWYDSRGLPSNPGQQTVFNFGWSGAVKEWRTAKYALNSFLDSLDVNSRVRLRVAFAANASNPGETDFGGVAFDNFFIGNRDRKVLVEHFTNQNSPTYTADNTEYNDFVNLFGNELINIRYHTDFPEPDDLFSSNPAIPGARSIYYGISETSNNAIDGTFNPQPLGNWGNTFFNERTLEAAPYQIDFTFDSDPVDMLNVNVNITTTSSIADREDTLDLYIAVVENFPDMTNVVRQMMPSVSGTRINWPAGDTTETFSFSQLITNVDNTANVSLVAFLQDTNTKEIHQAEDTIPPSVPSVVTGIEDELFGPLEVELYPNPTQGLLNISFSKPLHADTEWEVYNTFGQLVKKGVFMTGSTKVVLPGYDFAQGVYILRLGGKDNEEQMALKKFMVVK